MFFVSVSGVSDILSINPIFLIYHLTPNIAKITNTREAQATSSFFITVDSELKEFVF